MKPITNSARLSIIRLNANILVTVTTLLPLPVITTHHRYKKLPPRHKTWISCNLFQKRLFHHRNSFNYLYRYAFSRGYPVFSVLKRFKLLEEKSGRLAGAYSPKRFLRDASVCGRFNPMEIPSITYDVFSPILS